MVFNDPDTFNLLLQRLLRLQPSLEGKRQTETNWLKWKTRPKQKHPYKWSLSDSIQQSPGSPCGSLKCGADDIELTGECVLAVMEAMAVLDSLICRLKSCLSSRPRWLKTWSNRTTPSSCFWKMEATNSKLWRWQFTNAHLYQLCYLHNYNIIVLTTITSTTPLSSLLLLLLLWQWNSFWLNESKLNTEWGALQQPASCLTLT